MNNNVTALVSNTHSARQAVQTEMQNGLSQAQIAIEAGVSASALSMWLKEKYAGDNSKMDEAIEKWLNHKNLKRQSSTVLPVAPGYVETPTAKIIAATLSYAQLANDLVVLYGGAGVGKTSAIAHYAESNPNVFVMECTPSSGTLGGFLRGVAAALNVRITAGHTDALDIAIREKLKGTDGLLIIDEAQFLNERALESARRITELANVGLAICGNETVYTQLTGRHRAASFAQLFSRIGKRLRLTRPRTEDSQAIAKAWGVENKEEQKLLSDIAARPGGLRSVTKTLRLASMLAGAEQLSITAQHIKTAWADLSGDM